ncbi:TPA: hypothetical protein ACL55V_001745, partial [Streptococcus pneumoniae]
FPNLLFSYADKISCLSLPPLSPIIVISCLFFPFLMQGKLLSLDDNPKARKVSQTSLLSQTSLQLKGKDSIL